jgi:phosphate transport system permease protein
MINNKIIKKRRYIFEYLFKGFGIISIILAISMLFLLLYSIVSKGYSAFYTHYILITINSSDIKNSPDYEDVDYDDLIYMFLNKNIRNNNHLQEESISFDSIISSLEINKVKVFFKHKDSDSLNGDYTFKLLVSSNADMVLKDYLGSGSLLNDSTIDAIKNLKAMGIITSSFNSLFFSNADSRYPELAGIKGAFLVLYILYC